MDPSEPPPSARVRDDAASACCPAATRVLPALLGAFAGLILALAASLILGPTYEATAFLEAAPVSALPTLEEKLRFPSLYRAATDSADAARDLARRTRIRVRRGSQLLAVTVGHSEPARAAAEADRLAAAFLASLKPGAPATPSTRPPTPEAPPRPVATAALPDPAAADSPQSLAEAWETQRAEFDKLSARYGHDAAHPAVAGARQRLDALGRRILDRVAELRSTLGLPALTPAPGPTPPPDPGAALRDLLAAVEPMSSPAAPAPAPSPEASPSGSGAAPSLPQPVTCVLAEPASLPDRPVGPGRPAIAMAGAAAGAFLALLWGWCCPGCCRRRPGRNSIPAPS